MIKFCHPAATVPALRTCGPSYASITPIFSSKASNTPCQNVKNITDLMVKNLMTGLYAVRYLKSPSWYFPNASKIRIKTAINGSTVKKIKSCILLIFKNREGNIEHKIILIKLQIKSLSRVKVINLSLMKP
ncbi:hypothetical protein BpHYR1_008269 [Brachionus plicatilis]|uniref:Uncharacterized protein n=1 Tax=Brachionus plicatilis TaxID=10195 RepID=A0A3M7STA5_BRAPC|nr:hypothetical protein BpHYR1_008269 [Brachionus plicatilis]